VGRESNFTSAGAIIGEGGGVMRLQRKCGILELGNLEATDEEPGALLRTRDGEEILLRLTKAEAQQIAVDGLLFRNLTLTITLEDDGTTPEAP
jgi:hypothetical protein